MYEIKKKNEELESAETRATDGGSKITTTQWLSVISIAVSLAGLYYKREEIKSAFTKPPPSPFLPPAPPPTPVDVAPKRKEAIKWMD